MAERKWLRLVYWGDGGSVDAGSVIVETVIVSVDWEKGRRGRTRVRRGRRCIFVMSSIRLCAIIEGFEP
jgi:hypothetical protein